MPYVNHGAGAQQTANCAMCSLAGVLGTTTATIQTMLSASGQSDDHLATALGHGALIGSAQQQAVMNSMIRFVQQASRHASYAGAPLYGYQFGFADHYKDHGAVSHYMAHTANGTKFCVWGYLTNEIEGLGAHWNYAEKTAMGIEYRDYQYNMSATTPPKTGTHFIAPMGSGESDMAYNSFIVLYFGQQRVA